MRPLALLQGHAARALASTLGSGPSGGPNPSAEDGDSLETHLVLLTMLGGVVVASSLETLQHRTHLTWIPESSLAVLAGIALGAVIRTCVAASSIPTNLVFNGDIFFLVALPVLIFDAGYSLRKREFFGQLFSILTFSVLGTAAAAAVIGGILYGAGALGASLKLDLNEAMAFGSVLSATDALATAAVLRSYGGVDPALIALIMGEGALSDATSIVLYQTFAGFYVEGVQEDSTEEIVALFCTELFASLLLGVAVSVAATLAFRAVHMGWWPHARHLPFAFRVPRDFFNARLLELQDEQARALLGGSGSGSGGSSSDSKGTLSAAAAEERVPFALAGSSSGSSAAPATPSRDKRPAVSAVAAALAAPVPAPPPAPAPAPAAAGHGHHHAGGRDFDEEIRRVKQFLRRALPLTERRLLEPKPESSVFAQTTFIILMVRCVCSCAARGRGPPPPLLPPTHPRTRTLCLAAHWQGYVSYLTAESLHLSGVVAVLFCGIGMNHFLRPLLTREGKEFSEGLVRVLSVTADTSVFFQVGLDIALTIGTSQGLDGRGEGEMVGWTFLALVVSRTVTIFPIAFFLNYVRGVRRRIPWEYVVVLWFSAMRGASSYAFALVFPTANRGVLVDLTASVVLASVLLYSTVLRSLLGCLGLLRAAGGEGGGAGGEGGAEAQGRFLPTEADDSDEEEVKGGAAAGAAGAAGAAAASGGGGAGDAEGAATPGGSQADAGPNYRVVIVQGVRVYLPKRPTAAKAAITFLNRVDVQLRWAISGVVRE